MSLSCWNLSVIFVVIRMSSKLFSSSHNVCCLPRTIFRPLPSPVLIQWVYYTTFCIVANKLAVFAQGAHSPGSFRIPPSRPTPLYSINSYRCPSRTSQAPLLQEAVPAHTDWIRGTILWAYTCGRFYQSTLSAHCPSPSLAHECIEDRNHMLFILVYLMSSTRFSQKKPLSTFLRMGKRGNEPINQWIKPLFPSNSLTGIFVSGHLSE